MSENARNKLEWIQEDLRKERKAKYLAFIRVCLTGFTCVVFLLALNWSGCHHGHGRLGANENGAIVTIKAISVGQEQFRSHNCVDQDSDGVGEYGTLAELSGAVKIRGSDSSCAKSPFILMILNPAGKAFAYKSGYNYIIYLAGKKRAITDLNRGDPPNTDLQEVDFVAYAWPVTYGKSGDRVFAINSQGLIMQMPNRKGLWSGDKVPPPGLAMIDGLDPSISKTGFVRKGDLGSAEEPWTPIE